MIKSSLSCFVVRQILSANFLTFRRTIFRPWRTKNYKYEVCLLDFLDEPDILPISSVGFPQQRGQWTSLDTKKVSFVKHSENILSA